MSQTKSPYYFYLKHLLPVFIFWLALDFLKINIQLDFLKSFLNTILQSQVALIAIVFVVQVPRLEKYKQDPLVQSEIKEDWKKFLQRFIVFIIFTLASLLVLNYFNYVRLSNLILVITVIWLTYLFESLFSYIKNI